MAEAVIEKGCAQAPAGTWLVGRSQPAACLGTCRSRSLRGFIVPDRARVLAVTADGPLYCAAADRPFLLRLDALPDETLNLVSEKLLLAPLDARTGAHNVKLVPFSFKRVTPVTEFRKGWAVAATRSRVTRLAVEEGGTLTVRSEALVAWVGRDPSGFCPRLGLWDLLLPRGPKNLAYNFHGPCTVWFEGAEEVRPMRMRMGMR